MSLLKQINEKGAVLEWSPIASQANLVALGTKDSSGVGFDDYGGELELHSLDLKDSQHTGTQILGKVRANSRFSSIAWSKMALNNREYPYGLIAGGMIDGFVHIWDAAKLASNDPDPLIASIEQHQGGIRGLQFNPHKESSHLLASGGNDGEVYVLSLERPDEPNVFVPAPPPNNTKHTAEISKVAWNTQVAYILASAAQNGSCFVWDLRQKKAWCELRDPTGGSIADIAWNPDQGLNIITASGDDKNPVIKLWDLRSSTSLPLATLQGHTQGILSASWCPTDPSLILSCGKDNQTILWDLFHLQPIYNLPSYTIPDSNESNVFGSLASTAGQRRYNVSWSPCIPAVIGVCSFDRKVQFYSLSGVKSKLNRAPKWLRKPVGATFGFGGKLVSFTNTNVTNDAAKKNGSITVTISQITEDNDLVQDIDNFHTALNSNDIKNFCDYKINQINLSSHEKDIWSLIKVVCIETNARNELMKFLGYTNESVTNIVTNYLQTNKPIDTPVSTLTESTVGLSRGLSAEDLFSSQINEISLSSSNDVIKNQTIESPELILQSKEIINQLIETKQAEPIILQAILIGNFEYAVDCCLQAGLLAEALVLSQCGDPNLYKRTQEKYFSIVKSKRYFINILHTIINSDIYTYIKSSDLTKWKETLALINTYSKTNEFQSLCELLATRLDNELNDTKSSILCYMCSGNISKTINYFTFLLTNENNHIVNKNNLQSYIEKIMIYLYNNKQIDLLYDSINYIIQYIQLLINQGKIDYTLRYIPYINQYLTVHSNNNNQDINILLDRLYHSSNKPSNLRPPVFPYTKVDVKIVSTPVDSKPKPIITTNPTSNSNVVDRKAKLVSSVNTPASVSTLPSGWLELTDPASGRLYYVNQATNQSQWEYPVIPENKPIQSQPQTIPQAKPQGYQPLQSTSSSNLQSNFINQGPTNYPVVNQPVGFVPQPNQSTNSFNPAVNSQFNTFTPVANTFSPTPAVQLNSASAVVNQPAVNTTASVAPVVAPAKKAENVPLPESVHILGGLISQIGGTIVNPADKRQFTAVNQSYNTLCEKISSNEVSADVLQKISLLVQELTNRSYSSANAIQVDLANTVWSQHKEWLKGIKVLIQLASKKT